ncbi:MAG: circularly permuted type 2 ATP-grasp protein [Actinobacteria bacterium]|nr:circularly permuted type 2 ATP-grasp protein [Actinomycetota bacterium]
MTAHDRIPPNVEHPPDLRGLHAGATQIRRALDDLGGVVSFDHVASPVTRTDLAADHNGRPQLDPIPLVVEQHQWATLSRALEQRAKVLELVLDDLFGPQRLLSSGHLPTEAIVSHREYLRQCVGISRPGQRPLVLYACDLARTTDGTLTVLADRTQLPSGIAQAVQMREVMARVQPKVLADRAVMSIEPWLSSCRATLGALAPPSTDTPRIVMMTPGSIARAHPEHAYLARMLGFTLVEPPDLTVRDGSVWLKSVAGLEPVHVIMRLVPSVECDPLELDSSSISGVPGLVEACRRGTVALANPLGSGVAECTALLNVLPALTRTLLGEEPLIDSAPTWWCGDATGRSHVIANLDRLLIRSAVPIAGRHTRFGRLLSAAEREDLAREINAAPHQFVGQEEVEIARQPVFDNDRITEQPVVTRAFLVASDDGFACMNGGLSVTAPHAGEIAFDSLRCVKDTWVTTTRDPGHEPQRIMASTATHLAPVDFRDSITSRAAASMYWIGRNLERAQAAIRLIRAVSLLHESRHELWIDDRPEIGASVEALISAVVGPPASLHPSVESRKRLSNELLPISLTDNGRPRSLASSMYYLLQNAESVRQLFSADSWRALHRIGERYSALLAYDATPPVAVAMDCLAPLLELSALISESMVRDPGWWFLDIGRRIEGLSLITESVRATLLIDPPGELAPPLWDALLGTWDGLFAYRRRYRSDIEPSLLIDLLVCDPSNPRSIRGQLDTLTADLNAVSHIPGTPTDLLLVTQSLREALETTIAPALAKADHNGKRRSLGLITNSITAAVAALAAEIDLTYFVQLSARHLGSDSIERPTRGAPQ